MTRDERRAARAVGFKAGIAAVVKWHNEQARVPFTGQRRAEWHRRTARAIRRLPDPLIEAEKAAEKVAKAEARRAERERRLEVGHILRPKGPRTPEQEAMLARAREAIPRCVQIVLERAHWYSLGAKEGAGLRLQERRYWRVKDAVLKLHHWEMDILSLLDFTKISVRFEPGDGLSGGPEAVPAPDVVAVNPDLASPDPGD